MKKGKYEKAPLPKKKSSLVKLLPLLLVVLILGVSLGGTLAYLTTQSTQVSNDFIAGRVSCEVQANKTVKNTGNTDAYIRAMVIVNWMDADGNVSAVAPDYTVTPGAGWEIDAASGIYYYTSAVAPGAFTSAFQVTTSEENPDVSQYSMTIEIVAEAIQADGIDAAGAKETWDKAKDTPVTGN